MKDEFDKAIEQALLAKNVNFFGKVAVVLSSKYGVSLKTIHNRFHSIYGSSFHDYVDSRILPSREDLVSLILNTTSSEDVMKNLGLSHRKFVGIYDKLFGVSTYQKAKAKILMEVPSSVRLSSLREDNVAILMSQYLGDGSYDRVRHALRIQHGEKQAEYLRWKVGMLKEGYNLQTTDILERTHIQGHRYYDWYSRKLGNVDFPEDKSEAVGLLTPLGWLLWYLDDGSYCQDISICVNLEKVAKVAQSELATYGIKSRVNKVSQKNAYNLTMCGTENTIGFYKCFIEPFLNIIPNCMQYKTEVKI